MFKTCLYKRKDGGSIHFIVMANSCNKTSAMDKCKCCLFKPFIYKADESTIIEHPYRGSTKVLSKLQ